MATVSNPTVIVDAGPLVALLVESDSHHKWAVAQMARLPAPFLTCDAVLSEAFFLTSRVPHGPERLFDVLESGLLVSDFPILREQTALRRLIQKYRDLPMSLADVCLVRMSELHPRASVFTVDSDFLIYRKNGRQTIPVIMPPQRRNS